MRKTTSSECEICGDQTHWLFLIRNSRDYLLRYVGQNYVDFWVCESCGLVKQIPKVPATSGRGVYRLKEFRPFSAREYLETSELAKTTSDQCNWILKPLANRNVGSVLDVGCAAGSLLGQFKQRGWHTYGVEPTEEFAVYARSQGHDVKTGYLGYESFGRLKFDLVAASHVLEHMHDPVLFLSQIKTKMDANGYLFVEVPNILRPYGHIWFLFFSVNHVYHFTAITLRSLLDRCGLMVVDSQTVNKGVRVLCRSSQIPQSRSSERSESADVVSAVDAFKREAFYRSYVQQHVAWDVKLALLKGSSSLLGAERGQHFYDWSKHVVRRLLGRRA